MVSHICFKMHWTVKSISHIVSVRVSSLDGYKPTMLPLKVLVMDYHVFLLFTFPILFFLSLSPTAYFLCLIFSSYPPSDLYTIESCIYLFEVKLTEYISPCSHLETPWLRYFIILVNFIFLICKMEEFRVTYSFICEKICKIIYMKHLHIIRQMRF